MPTPRNQQPQLQTALVASSISWSIRLERVKVGLVRETLIILDKLRGLIVSDVVCSGVLEAKQAGAALRRLSAFKDVSEGTVEDVYASTPEYALRIMLQMGFY